MDVSLIGPTPFGDIIDRLRPTSLANRKILESDQSIFLDYHILVDYFNQLVSDQTNFVMDNGAPLSKVSLENEQIDDGSIKSISRDQSKSIIKSINPDHSKSISISDESAQIHCISWRGRESTPQLTSWRTRDNDFTTPIDQTAEETGTGTGTGTELSCNGDAHSNEDDGCQRLAPEDLPRLYPEWTLGLPFLFDEQTDDETKGCCGNGRVSHSTFLRWFIIIISLIGLSCVIVGVVLGSLMESASSRFTLSLLMIGAGTILITVSGLAWRLTILEMDCLPGPSCFLSDTMMNTIQRPRSVATSVANIANSRLPYSRVGRRRLSNQFHVSNVFQNADFVWRPPPPSYQTAVRDQFLRNTPCDRQPIDTRPVPYPDSPPPTYRSRDGHSRPCVSSHLFLASSRPPSYSANESSQNHFPPSLDTPILNSPQQSSTPQTNDPSSVSQLAPPTTIRHDEISLVLNEDLSECDWTSESCFTRDSQNMVHRLTIIDCSDPVPVGFELRHNGRPLGCQYRARRYDEVFLQSYV